MSDPHSMPSPGIQLLIDEGAPAAGQQTMPIAGKILVGGQVVGRWAQTGIDDFRGEVEGSPIRASSLGGLKDHAKAVLQARQGTAGLSDGARAGQDAAPPARPGGMLDTLKGIAEEAGLIDPTHTQHPGNKP